MPPGIRLVQPGDERPLFDLCMEAYRENGWGGCDPTAVREVLGKAIAHDGMIMAVIPGPDRLEAVIGFQPARNWYGDAGSWYYVELLVFVHPLHRKSRHAVTLMRFAKWFEAIAEAPVLICSMPRGDAERKRRFFSRYGSLVTDVFMIGDGTFRYMKSEAA
jgi:hypothetical protein